MLGVRNDYLREASLLRANERGKRTRGKHVPFLIEREKSLRHVVMVAKFLNLNKPKSCKVGGHNLPLLVSRFPASRTFLSLCLPTPALCCVSPVIM